MLPGHHIANSTEFIREGATLRPAFPGGGMVDLSWTISLAAILAWIGALWGATFAAFRRQDIN